MNDNNYLKDIISTSKTVAVKTYYYLEDILVFKEYEINEDDDLITQTKQFILRYRRLIGLILLAILLYIWFYCDVSNNKNKSENKEYSSGTRERVQKGGFGDIPAPPPLPPSLAPPKTPPRPQQSKFTKDIAQGAAQMQKRSKPQPTFEEKEKAKYETKKAKATLQAQFKADNAKAATNKAASETKAKIEEDKKAKQEAIDKRKGMGRMEKLKVDSAAGTALQREKLKGAYKESAVGKKVEEFKSMRASGFSTKAAIGKNVYQAGAYVGEKFKEFAGWLYEILFAIAISIAICMVVLPSVSFFILALICFFLLKKKVSQVKGL